MKDSYKYFYEEYSNDMSKIVKAHKKAVNPHVVGIYPNSLSVALHLSNALNCPLSIVTVINGTADWLINVLEDKTLRNKPRFFPTVITIADQYDSGEQMRAVQKLPEFDKNIMCTFITLFGSKNDDNVFYEHEQLYKKIFYPWSDVVERRIVFKDDKIEIVQ
jgi:hypothetical protein